MSIVKVGPKFQVTIPKKVREVAHLEVGDYVETYVVEGAIVLRPKKLVDKEESWFWAEEWQKKEREADDDISAGRVYGPFGTVEDLKRSLES